MTAPASTTRKGAAGEARAAAFLESRGWSVLDRNFRLHVGEIDLVARRGDVLAFVEVKAWRTMPVEDLAISIGPRKRARIARAAAVYVARRPELRSVHTRFDIVFLGGDGGIRHIPDAFTGEGID